MDDEVFNKSVRVFLKKVGITSQRALEDAVQKATANGRLKGNENIGVKIRLESDLLDQPLEIDGTLELS
ncbi:MAG TPA: DUF6494 family protein [Gammaproteobacteria bacterium]|jgi:hypothetical protein|nr:DUF6494 family protein [Gammaproteobacteria bacterium]